MLKYTDFIFTESYKFLQTYKNLIRSVPLKSKTIKLQFKHAKLLDSYLFLSLDSVQDEILKSGSTYFYIFVNCYVLFLNY